MCAGATLGDIGSRDGRSLIHALALCDGDECALPVQPFDWMPHAGSPPRHAGNVLLLLSTEVADEEALDRKSPDAFAGPRLRTAPPSLARTGRCALAAAVVRREKHRSARPANGRCTPNSRVRDKRRSGGASSHLVHALVSPGCTRRQAQEQWMHQAGDPGSSERATARVRLKAERAGVVRTPRRRQAARCSNTKFAPSY